MTLHLLFPTAVYSANLATRTTPDFDRCLLREARQIRLDDAAGRRWSKTNYPAGYTSYATAHRLHRFSPTFALLASKLARHVRAFAAAAQWDMTGRALLMTDCWINIMQRSAYHGLHLHPLSTLSGTYYVKVPKNSAGIKFEDPRLGRLMTAPPRIAVTRRTNSTWISFPAAAGRVILFESWLRHEVAANACAGERVSVSFNYGIFDR